MGTERLLLVGIGLSGLNQPGRSGHSHLAQDGKGRSQAAKEHRKQLCFSRGRYRISLTRHDQRTRLVELLPARWKWTAEQCHLKRLYASTRICSPALAAPVWIMRKSSQLAAKRLQ